MYYLGFLKDDTKNVVIFKALKKPRRGDYSYFTQVMGPYDSEKGARSGLTALKRAYGEYGYQVNAIKGLITKDGIRKAIALTRKVVKIYGVIRKQNPGQVYHDRKFMGYMKELDKYAVGSVSYMTTLTKAHEHLQSAKASMEECVR